MEALARDDDDDTLRLRVGRVLHDGLVTEWRERADGSEAVNTVVARLAATAPEDLGARLAIAGFTLQPYRDESGASNDDGDDAIVQACETCMYYAPHRRFCDLPELRLPVRPEWSCRLWRI